MRSCRGVGQNPPMARPSLPSAPVPENSRRIAAVPAMLLAIMLAVASLLLASCGGDDGGDEASDDDSGSEQADAETTDGETTDEGGDDAAPAGDEVFDPATVKACLSDAGFETVTSSEVLSEQQVADQLTAFGQTEALTFEAEQNAFAGGVSFYETPEQASDRAESLSQVAKSQTQVGNALVSIEAGSDYEDAVAAAESCLGV